MSEAQIAGIHCQHVFVSIGISRNVTKSRLQLLDPGLFLLAASAFRCLKSCRLRQYTIGPGYCVLHRENNPMPKYVAAILKASFIIDVEGKVKER